MNLVYCSISWWSQTRRRISQTISIPRITRRKQYLNLLYSDLGYLNIVYLNVGYLIYEFSIFLDLQMIADDQKDILMIADTNNDIPDDLDPAEM